MSTEQRVFGVEQSQEQFKKMLHFPCPLKRFTYSLMINDYCLNLSKKNPNNHLTLDLIGVKIWQQQCMNVCCALSDRRWETCDV